MAIKSVVVRNKKAYYYRSRLLNIVNFNANTTLAVPTNDMDAYKLKNFQAMAKIERP